VPLVIAISGLDSRKEDLSENFGAILPYGIGFIGLDSPGTGQSPIKASETAEREFSRVIDYLQTRPEVDRNASRHGRPELRGVLGDETRDPGARALESGGGTVAAGGRDVPEGICDQTRRWEIANTFSGWVPR